MRLPGVTRRRWLAAEYGGFGGNRATHRPRVARENYMCRYGAGFSSSFASSVLTFLSGTVKK